MFASTLFFLYLEIKMDKTSPKITQDKGPKRVDAGRKGRENFMKKIKENILNDAKKGSGDTNNSSNETTNVTNTTTTKSNDTYVYGIGIVAILALVPVYFLHTTLSLKIKNKPMKNRINHQNKVICIRFYIINE